MVGGVLDDLVPVARGDLQGLVDALKKAGTSVIVPGGRLLVGHDG